MLLRLLIADGCQTSKGRLYRQSVIDSLELRRISKKPNSYRPVDDAGKPGVDCVVGRVRLGLDKESIDMSSNPELG